MAHPWDERWLQGNRLGSGGQGVTYLVTDKHDPSSQGVLKYLRNNKSVSSRARMKREVASLQLLAALKARVPNVLDHNTEYSADPSVELYLVMKHIPGDTLEEFRGGRTRLPVDHAINFALNLCETIKIAHKEGVLHRDIKPNNIIVSNAESSSLFIVDYGLSFNADDEDVTVTLETFKNKFLDLPETNTPGGDLRDARSDVTAACAIFYYLLTGHKVGQLQDSSGRLAHLRHGFTVKESVPDDARQTQIELILSRGLSPSIMSRFQNIEEFSNRLSTLLDQSSESYVQDPIALAAELSNQFRAQDRKTQIMEFKPAATQLLKGLTARIDQIGKQLGRFNSSMKAGGQNGPKLDGSLDYVAGPFNAHVRVDHHQLHQGRVYMIASRDEQSVVLGCDIEPGSNKGETTLHEWQEIAWYEGDPTDILDTLVAEYKQWLSHKLTAIASEVL
ncbi:serine/threonine protein kinase [Adhaeretor mobilis]|uniref:Serine/threonine-protein kinase PrkC n=1 Tax=Adhaeretor mobilis TaxID=1930276 RepID=A0A517MUE8_9BACT|nr:protein kinase [Adhaeretor mobilis]QDS98511.1 Serine/threonine-protein kinase PrkC [Adhaeretor mobilis]